MILSPILTLDPGKVERDLAFVMDCLAEVLEESREPALASQLPWRQASLHPSTGPASPQHSALGLRRSLRRYCCCGCLPAPRIRCPN